MSQSNLLGFPGKSALLVSSPISLQFFKVPLIDFRNLPIPFKKVRTKLCQCSFLVLINNLFMIIVGLCHCTFGECKHFWSMQPFSWIDGCSAILVVPNDAYWTVSLMKWEEMLTNHWREIERKRREIKLWQMLVRILC